MPYPHASYKVLIGPCLKIRDGEGKPGNVVCVCVCVCACKFTHTCAYTWFPSSFLKTRSQEHALEIEEEGKKMS